jgi:hypothetical protein
MTGGRLDLGGRQLRRPKRACSASRQLQPNGLRPMASGSVAS